MRSSLSFQGEGGRRLRSGLWALSDYLRPTAMQASSRSTYFRVGGGGGRA